MNGSAAATAGVAITGGSIGTLIDWLCQIAHLPVPPDSVAVTLGALALSAAHYAMNQVAARKPAPTNNIGA